VKITGNPDGVEQKDQSPPKKRTTPKFGKDKSLIAGRTSENATARVPLDAAETKKISHGNDKQVAGVGQIGNDQESEKPHSIQTSTSSIAMKISNLPKAIKSGRTSPEISVTDKVAIAEVKEPLSTLAGNGTADYGGDDRDSDDEEVDGDQTAALIRGFEASDGDDSDENGSTEEEKYENGEDLPKVDIPLKDQAALQALKKKASTSPGVVYIGYALRQTPHIRRLTFNLDACLMASTRTKCARILVSLEILYVSDCPAARRLGPRNIMPSLSLLQPRSQRSQPKQWTTTCSSVTF
jgi:hypothetical protein